MGLHSFPDLAPCNRHYLIHIYGLYFVVAYFLPTQFCIILANENFFLVRFES